MDVAPETPANEVSLTTLGLRCHSLYKAFDLTGSLERLKSLSFISASTLVEDDPCCFAHDEPFSSNSVSNDAKYIFIV